MRLYFTEAAAYLKYYDQIEDIETRGYILRSRANIALGQFGWRCILLDRAAWLIPPCAAWGRTAQRRGSRGLVRHLYWLGMGRNCLCGKLVGIPFENIAKYMTRMRDR